MLTIRRLLCVALAVVFAATTSIGADLPNPVLNSVFPAGGQAGGRVEVTVSGTALEGLTTLHASHPRITFKQLEKNRFQIAIPKDVPSGVYDLRAVGRNGVSSPRTFVVGNRTEQIEADPNETPQTAQTVPLNVAINGRIEKGGDLDHFRFTAKRGQRVIIECAAERIDSRLRAMLELYDAQGKRLAANRGYFGVDPLIDFRVPADGAYIVKLFDLVYSGSADHFYRLEIDTGPRVAFTVPSVVEKGKTTRVTLYGWNLHRDEDVPVAKTANSASAEASDAGAGVRELDSGATGSSRPKQSRRRGTLDTFDRVEVDVTPPKETNATPLPIRLRPSQVALDGFAYWFPGAHAPVLIGVTDVPVVGDRDDNRSPGSAQEIVFPCEVSGQLLAGDERDWYAITAKRGEVLWIEAFGERIDSPVDLDVSVLDASGDKELARFSDEVQNIGGTRFPSSHLDPAGRWVVPADGRYLILIRNLIGSLDDDPRRRYRLSVRREEPNFQLAIVPHLDAPAALNVSRGGRAIVDVLAFRRRGLTGPIRVSAKNLPDGIECPDIWLGPGVNRAPLTVTAGDSVRPFVAALTLEGHAPLAGNRKARGGTIVRTGLPNGWGRLTSDILLAVRGEAPLRITADCHETRMHNFYGELKVRHSPGGILDVAVHVNRRDAGHTAPVELIGVGLPDQIRNQTATIPAGKNKGYVSFYLPPTLRAGRYTIVVQGRTTVPIATKSGKPQTKSVTVFSDPVTFHVQPAAFVVEVDPYVPKKIKRGKIVQIKYTAKRINGFISKIYTQLSAADQIIGLRARGVTFVSQTNSGTIQIIANDDAPLGRQPFLRLYAVGVVEDQPVYHGSCFLNLEIVE